MESFNGIFRLCSILSNHQAASRDIAFQFSSLEGFKSRLSGARRRLPNTDRWRSPGKAVLNALKDHKILQRHLGWSPESADGAPGSVKATSQRKRKEKRWSSTSAAGALNQPPNTLPHSLWIDGQSVLSRVHEVCSPGFWIVARSPINDVRKQVHQHLLLIG
jgi:hypothetical protein